MSHRLPLDNRVVLRRLSDELAGLQGVASALQAAMHELPLAASSAQTRISLQAVDRLTQSLEALSQVTLRLAALPDRPNGAEFEAAIRVARLESVRRRLLLGCAPAPDPPDQIDLF